MPRRIQRYRPPASGIMAESSEDTKASGTLQTSGSTRIMMSVSPGPEDETTSSMPNDPEHVSVKTNTTAVISRIRTRFSPSFRSISVIRTPPRVRLTKFYDSASGASCQRSTASLSFSP